MTKKIKKIDIDLYSDNCKDEYEKCKVEYIAEYEEDKGLFRGYQLDPIVGEAKWNEKYPRGFKDWIKNRYKLDSWGQQQLIDKINEIIEVLNKTDNKK